MDLENESIEDLRYFQENAEIRIADHQRIIHALTNDIEFYKEEIVEFEETLNFINSEIRKRAKGMS